MIIIQKLNTIIPDKCCYVHTSVPLESICPTAACPVTVINITSVRRAQRVFTTK